MSVNLDDLRAEANDALEDVWFVQRLQEVERTDTTLSILLDIHPGLLVHIFHCERSGALYFALIEDGHRAFDIDREYGEWHMHPYGTPEEHRPLARGLEPKPLRSFLRQVEEILLDNDLV